MAPMLSRPQCVKPLICHCHVWNYVIMNHAITMLLLHPVSLLATSTQHVLTDYHSSGSSFNYRDQVNTCLTYWGPVTHICISKLTITGSDNGLSPGRRQAIIWTNAGILLIGPLGTNFSQVLIEIHKFSFKKMRLKVSSGKWRPCCLGLNVLIHWFVIVMYEIM